ncbi:MAG TPA: hypothetical protein PKA27_01665 [Fimbriimonadaceae bacterium]|nr:hypothetical protein [Fimbriimonadaceae bacterium]
MGHKRAFMLPEALSYAGVTVFVLASFAGMASVTDKITIEKERRAELGLDLVNNIRDLAPRAPLAEKDNAAALYRKSDLAISEEVQEAMLAVLDGRPANRDAVRDFIRAHKESLDFLKSASQRPRFHLTPNLSEPYLAEYEPLKHGAMVFAVKSVLDREPEHLKIAARITRHSAEGSFRESAHAHFLGRLYVFKALDRLGVEKPDIVELMGPEPNLKRMLRGELIHDLALAKADPTFQSNPIMPMFGRTAESRLMRLWHDAFPRIPGEPEKYFEAVGFFDQFEARYRRRRVIGRYFREGYADLARLAQEARELRLKHEEIVVETQ